MKKVFLLFILFLSLQATTIAQVFNPWGPPPNHKEIKPNFFRFLLSHVSAEVGLGYGSTRYFQNLDQFQLYSYQDQLLLAATDSTGNNTLGIANWINNSFVSDSLNYNQAVLYEASNNENDPDAAYLIVDGQKRLRGSGNAIPLHIKAFISYDRFRVGGGATFELNSKANLNLSGYPDYIAGYQSDYKTFFTQKYYFLGGVRYYDFWDYSYYAEVEYGKFRFSDGFNAANINYSRYWNVSLPIEKNFSEYFHLVIRPSIDFKSIEHSLPTGDPIKTKMWNVQVQAGIRISFPLYPKCPISNCEMQKEHMHIDKKFRGQPIYKKQNPKVGENDPYLGTEKRTIFSIFKRK